MTRRLTEVVRLVQAHRAGATFAEIVEAAKAGQVSDADAIAALEREFEGQQRYRQEREIPVGMMIEDDLAEPNTAETTLLRREATNAILRVVNSLPMRQAQCCELYFLGDQTQPEIAARLGIAQQQVSKYIARGIEKLSETLAREGVFEPLRAVTYGEVFMADLMRNPWRQDKHSHGMRFPWEVWMRWCVGAAWGRNGRYAARFENRLPEYLADCFEVPPAIGWFTGRAPR